MKRAPTKTKMDVIVEMLREAVLTGEFESGERLVQDELAERFQTSPTPIREAMRQLQAEGILTHSPYRGMQVAEVKLEDVREVYLIRAVMEAFVTRMAVSYIDRPRIHQLKSLQDEMQQHLQIAAHDKLRKLNYEFHFLIYEAADLPYSIKIIKSLWMLFPWDTLYVLPGRAERSIEEHALIIEAMAAQNGRLAAERMQEHIEYSAAALTAYLDHRSAT